MDRILLIINNIKNKVNFIPKFIKIGKQSIFIFIFFKKFLKMGLDPFKGLFTHYIGNIDNSFSFFNGGVVIPKPYNKLEEPRLKLLPFIMIFVRFKNLDFLIILIIIRVVKIIILLFPNILNYNNI